MLEQQARITLARDFKGISSLKYMVDSGLRSTVESNTEHTCVRQLLPMQFLTAPLWKQNSSQPHPTAEQEPGLVPISTGAFARPSLTHTWAEHPAKTSAQQSPGHGDQEVLHTLPFPNSLYIPDMPSKKPINYPPFFFLISSLTTVLINLSSTLVDSDPRSCFRACYLECQHP